MRLFTRRALLLALIPTLLLGIPTGASFAVDNETNAPATEAPQSSESVLPSTPPSNSPPPEHSHRIGAGHE